MALTATTTTNTPANTSAAADTGHSAPQRRSSASRPPSTLQLLRDTLSQETDANHATPTQPQPQSDETTAAHGFSTRQLAALSAPLERANVRQREQGRGSVSYLEGWQGLRSAHTLTSADGSQHHGQSSTDNHP